MLYKSILPQMEKTAGIMTKLSEDLNDWTSEITNAAYSQLPFLSGKEIEVNLQRVNEETKSALGIIKLASGKNSLVFPLIVKQGELFPMDVMFLNGNPMPATSDNGRAFTFDPKLFMGVDKAQKMNAPIPSNIFPYNLPSDVLGVQGTKLAEAISTHTSEEKYNGFINTVKSDKFINKYLGNKLDSFVRGEIKIAEKKESKPSIHIDCLVAAMDEATKEPYAIGVQRKPFEMVMYRGEELTKSASEAKAFESGDFIGYGPEEGIFIPTDQEGPQSGKVTLPTFGEGILFNTVVDFKGNHRDEKLFIGKDKYLFQEKIDGTLDTPGIDVSDKEIGFGVYYYDNGASLVATTPVEIKGNIGNYVSASVDGFMVKIAKSPNVIKPIQSGDMHLIPQESKFISLKGDLDFLPVKSTRELNEQDRVTIKFADTYSLSGPSLDRIELNDIPDEVTLSAILLALGATLPQIDPVIKTAQLYKSVDVYTKQRLVKEDNSIQDKVDKLINVFEKTAEDINKIVDKTFLTNLALIKKTAANNSDKSVDELLSLGFVGPDNVAMFINQIPSIQKTASSLASMLLASRLGVSSMPENAITSTIRGLNQILSSLLTARAGYTEE